MTRHSLRARLWVASLLSIALAVLLGGAGLLALFEHHVERRIGAELVSQLNQLAAALVLDGDGALALEREPLDPAFAQPMSGHYWQVDAPGHPGVLRARSLWDQRIELPGDVLGPGQVHAHQLPGPNGQALLVRERQIQIEAAPDMPVVRLLVARDRAELRAASRDFAADMQPYLVVIVLVLLAATLVQIQIGLAPLESVRRGVEAIRSGHARHLPASYPDEVKPLVAELNALLDARARALERARAWTADLAHGLKTPLSALAGDAQRLRARGEAELADDLEQLATTMRRRVERELVRARVRSGTAPHQARADAVDAIKRLLRTLERTPDGARVTWRLASPPHAVAAIMADDLLELLGNLLENAAIWARTGVWLQVTQDGGWIEIQVRDDGPGVPAAQRQRLGQRGLRLDRRQSQQPRRPIKRENGRTEDGHQAHPRNSSPNPNRDGNGLGLAIVRDVLDGYSGELAFDQAAEGGLLVRVRLLAAAPNRERPALPPRRS